MTEPEQARAVLETAQALANTLSNEGRHVDAGGIAALVQLARTLRTALVVAATEAAAAPPRKGKRKS